MVSIDTRKLKAMKGVPRLFTSMAMNSHDFEVRLGAQQGVSVRVSMRVFVPCTPAHS